MVYINDTCNVDECNVKLIKLKLNVKSSFTFFTEHLNMLHR